MAAINDPIAPCLTPGYFPGRWVSGVSLILAPLLMLAGVLLRLQFHFFFPQQLAAFHQDPARLSAAYSLFLAGNIALWPGILALTHCIGVRRPALARWGGAFVLFGLFARTFHAGIDHMAFQMTRVQGVESATRTVAQSYGAFHIVSAFTGTILIGWLLLALGAYLSGTFGLLRSLALALMSALMLGVLKGSSVTSVVAVSGLCVALVPLGFQLLLALPHPPARTAVTQTLLVLAVATALYFLGQAG